MNWKITNFRITDRQFATFTRHLPAPNDCVINLLEFLQLVTPHDAAIMRIFVGQTGVDMDAILAIFKFLFPNYEWRFQGVQDWNGVIDVVSNIEPGHVNFSGVQWKNGARHVMMMGRTLDNKVWLIDPQIQLVCSVRDKCFREYFEQVDVFFSLQNK